MKVLDFLEAVTYAVSPVGFVLIGRKKEPSRRMMDDPYRDDMPPNNGKVYIPCDGYLIGPK
jgi:hypothetical protein